MPEILKIILLAILQGVGEFIPISSSTHLAIVERLLGMDAPGVQLEVMLHFGTLLSILFFFRRNIALLLAGMALGVREAWRKAGLLALGCIPAGVAYLLLDDWLAPQFDGKNLRYSGLLLVLTGLLLLSLRFLKRAGGKPVDLWRTLAIGLAQACAIIPGVSRLGSTFACARYCGVSPKDAMEFSFLLSAPLVLAATILSLAKCGGGSTGAPGGWGILLPAMAVSAVLGVFALHLLSWIVAKGRFWMFGLYCVPAGILVFLFL